MSVNTIIQSALTFLDRPDLEDRLQDYFPKALRLVHSLQKFTRDMGYIYKTNPVISNNKTVLIGEDLPRLRNILKVATYTSYTTVGSGDTLEYVPGTLENDSFTNLNQGSADRDYFNFAYNNTVARVGNKVTLTGVSTSVVLVEILGVVWPTYEQNEFTEEWETSSWIAEEFPALIEAYLRIEGARIAQQADVLQQVQRDLIDVSRSFLIEYSGDIYGSQSFRR